MKKENLKPGDMVRCIRTMAMKDGEISFKEGNGYEIVSIFNDGLSLKDEQWDAHEIVHEMYGDWEKYFVNPKEDLILTVYDKGDFSVGIPSMSWEIQCPFQFDTDKDMIEEFRKDMIVMYGPFSNARPIAMYDFEEAIRAIKENEQDFEF